MSAIISSNKYGKSCVRILKVKRSGKIHDISELTVNIMLEGDFQSAHTRGDNSKVLPTDTMKNTVYALAKEDPVNSPEEFALHLSEYLLKNHDQVTKVRTEISEKLWKRIHIGEEKIDSDHSFISSGNEKKIVRVTLSEKERSVTSGLNDLLVLKTTDSGFENFYKDRLTTLKETSDRVFSTSITAEWIYNNENVNFNELHDSIRRILLETFAGHKSLSVQHTLYEMGKNVIESIRETEEIHITMPNKHYLLFDLEKLGLNNGNEIFIPTDEPFGLIDATVKRS
ncbi:MAG TPA: urate oxidase [Ignavibacteria bacterium]|nr:urate oxidase [Ignavibacteria bacterium]HMR40862.1 urate oxidase [Ignavibacteria bacterium]